ncbi:MAG: transcription termination factor Rho [Deltaproteobacteria bacterium]|nr:transcription termination factor Rho [Deltaproteobacteria bacterium]
MGLKKERKDKKVKPLDDWTIKELREEAMKVPNVQGIHGMNKQEIIEFLRVEKGLPAPASKKTTDGVRVFKEKVRQMRLKRDEERTAGTTRKRLDILRRKISGMKKKTRYA